MTKRRDIATVASPRLARQALMLTEIESGFIHREARERRAQAIRHVIATGKPDFELAGRWAA